MKFVTQRKRNGMFWLRHMKGRFGFLICLSEECFD